MKRTATLPLFSILVGITLLPACNRKTDATASAGSVQVDVACARCGTHSKLSLAKPADQEIWPQKCPSCNRTGAQPVGTCAACKEKIVFLDVRTQAYTVPTHCPKCGKTWQAAAKP